MAVKLRLARHGRKGRPFYHIIAADSRSPRDGRFLEKLGTYDPLTNPATIEINFDRAMYWLMVGAQPTPTTRRILSYRGLLMKKHLLEGVKKGAFDEQEAERRFEQWQKDKEKAIHSKVSGLADAKRKETKERLEKETKIKEQKLQEIAKKRAEAVAAIMQTENEAAEEVAETVETTDQTQANEQA